MTPPEQLFITSCIESIVQAMQENNPSLTPGEIYDAIAQELERRCQSVINRTTK
jgi:hypothetical protein